MTLCQRTTPSATALANSGVSSSLDSKADHTLSPLFLALSSHNRFSILSCLHGRPIESFIADNRSSTPQFLGMMRKFFQSS